MAAFAKRAAHFRFKNPRLAGVERRGVLGDVDARIVDAGRPVEDAGHLPAGVAGAVAGDALHCLDQLVVVDPPVSPGLSPPAVRRGHHWSRAS